MFDEGELAVSDLPWYVWALVLTGAIGMPSLVCVGLWRGAVDVGLGSGTGRRVAVTAGIVWAAWLAATMGLAAAGVYRQDPTAPPLWFGVAIVGTFVGVLLATRVPVVARILAGPRTPALLAWPHSVRVVGVLFLLVLALGKLPTVFAVLAGVGDILVGVSAPFVARRLSRGRAVWFNLSGILDMVVALTLGFLGALGPFRLPITPSTAEVALLPLALITTTVVPLALALHVTSLLRLRTRVATADPIPVG